MRNWMLGFIWIVGFLMTSVGNAVTISSLSTATDLIGGTVSVTHFAGTGMAGATFVAGPAGSVIASSPGSAGFDLTVSAGDTFSATWTLINTDPSTIFFNIIVSVSIDLTTSAGGALFDKDSLPSTPGSLSGILGVFPLGGITIGSAIEVNPWLDPLNTGDMFTAVNITFGGGFTAGASSSWADDTDKIVSVITPEPTPAPEPATVFLMSAGLLFALGRLRLARHGRRRLENGAMPLRPGIAAVG